MVNNYEFGNLIYEFRKKLKITQNELAKKVGVTGKAVSKWENGKAYPNFEVLKKLSLIFDVSIDDMLKNKPKVKKIIKIVITGGPCAGKTTGMSRIENYFTKKGYKVLFVSESATELINSGITPLSCASKETFQELLLKLQLKKEEIFEEAANSMDSDKVLIVCDRGSMDGKAYVNELEFKNMVKKVNSNEIDLRDNYDAVFHLVTAAKGAEKYYTKENNMARYESLEDAKICDDKIIKAWTGHQHLRIIDNSTDFDKKMYRLIKEISFFLGEPEPFEIERKFLIEYPNIKWLEKQPNVEKVKIVQTYLKSDDGNEIRIRQRGINGNFIYFKTIKKTINNFKRIEIEKRLSKDEYLDLLLKADPNKKTIIKTRYYLVYKNKCFEIDIYPFWSDKAILEIELNNENDYFEIPKQIKVIKEVTDDVRYKNSSLANSN